MGDFVVIFGRNRKKIVKMKMIVALVLFGAVASTQAIKWKSCGGSALNVKSLSVDQDPIVFPGPIDAHLEAETLQDMPAPIKIEMSLKKNGLTLPCIPVGDKMLGSCTYAGILGDLIAEAKLPCRCPLKKNPAVSIKHAHADLPKVPSFIAFLAEGEITIQAKASDASGNLLGCVELVANAHFEL